MTTADVIQTMTDRIVRDFHPLRVILFGSHARGDARPESDVDLLVVLPQVGNKRMAAVAIRRALADLPVCKDIVVTTPEEITRRGDLIGTVLRPALREGKVLYERTWHLMETQLDAINKASAREKSIRHGHPSTLHLWWARRPLAAVLQRIAESVWDFSTPETAWPLL